MSGQDEVRQEGKGRGGVPHHAFEAAARAFTALREIDAALAETQQ